MIGILAALLATASPALPDLAVNNQIIVQGHELSHDEVRHVIQSISKPESTGGFEWQYPRWKEAICVSVIGFPQDGGQYIADEIGEAARNLKLKVGGPGCSPTITILASSDPSDLIARMRRHRYDLIAGREPAVLDHMQKSTDPVRWLSFVGNISADGMAAIGEGAATLMQSAGTGINGSGAPATRAYDGGSLIKARTITYLSRVIAVVDSRQIAKVSYQQLADYLALISLAQLRPSGDLQNVESILSLFPSKEHAPTGLTKFDWAYLRALYRVAPDLKGVMQKGQLIGFVNQSLQTAQDTPDIPHAAK